MNWTREQQQAIELRGKNILVAAAAGSGKTAVLVERIKRLILEDRCPIDRMLIVTFTNAAAAEMKEKIYKAINQTVDEIAENYDADKSAGELAFLREQLNLLPTANISTFHAFALDIIRKYFYIIDVEPNFKICDEAQQTILRGNAMDELIEEFFEEGDPAFFAFLDSYSGDRNDDRLRVMIDKVYDTIQSLPDPYGWLEEKVQFLRCGFGQGEREETAAEQGNPSGRRAAEQGNPSGRRAAEPVLAFLWEIAADRLAAAGRAIEENRQRAAAAGLAAAAALAEDDLLQIGKLQDALSGREYEAMRQALGSFKLATMKRGCYAAPKDEQVMKAVVAAAQVRVAASPACPGVGDHAMLGIAPARSEVHCQVRPEGIGQVGQLVSGQAVSGQASSGQSIGGQPSSGQSMCGQPVSGPSIGGQPSGGQSSDGQLVSGQAVGGQSMCGQPVSGPSIGGQPSGRQSSGGQLVSGQAIGGQPSGGQSSGGQSIGGQAIGGQSIGGQSVGDLERRPVGALAGGRGAAGVAGAEDMGAPAGLTGSDLAETAAAAAEALKNAAAKNRDEAKKAIKSLKDNFFASSLEEIAEEMALTYSDGVMLQKLILRYSHLYREQKQKKNLVDFGDIEHYAYAILQDDQVSQFYREKFHHIFVDEYQDSNVMQEAFLERIRRPNNLFLVGDVKQSIYKFRLAEPEIFQRRYRQYAGPEETQSEKIDLNKNFRSKRPVIDFVNRIFSGLMDDYDENAALHMGDPWGDRFYDTPKLYLTQAPWREGEEIDDELKNMMKAEKEALAAVRLIRDSLGQPIYDSKAGIERPLTLRDIVILMRGVRGYGDIFSSVLMENDIPAYVDDNDGYFDTMEINAFLSLLSLIDNEKQDVPLLTVLRSEIFGFTVEELAAVRIAHREGSYYEAFISYGQAETGGAETGVSEPDPALRRKCASAISSLRKWQSQAVFMPLEELIWKLMLDTGFYLAMGALPGGRQRQANLRALVDKAQTYRKVQSGSLYGFIRYIETVKERKVPSGQVKMVGEGDELVKIMTIHKSKGLEFPMVIVSGFCRRLNYTTMGKSLVVHKDLGLGFPVVNHSENWYRTTTLQNMIKEKFHREEVEEEKRVLYVALTRAMDRLVLLGISNDIQADLDQVGTELPKDTSYFSMTGKKLYLTLKACRTIDDEELLRLSSYHSRRADAAVALLDQVIGSTTLAGGQAAPMGNYAVPTGGQAAPMGDEAARNGRQAATIRDHAASMGGHAALTDGRQAATVGGGALCGDETARGGGALAEQVARQMTFTYPNARELTLKSKYSVSELNAQGMLPEDDMPEVTAPDEQYRIQPLAEWECRNLEEPASFKMREVFSPAQRGTIYHCLLEHLDFRRAHGGGDRQARRIILEETRQYLIDEKFLTAQEAAVIDLSNIEKLLDSPLGKRMAQSPTLHREQPFTLKLDYPFEGKGSPGKDSPAAGGQAEGSLRAGGQAESSLRAGNSENQVIVQGVIDCYFEEDGGWVLVDYKTSRVRQGRSLDDEKKRIASHYQTQIAIYRRALEAITGIPVRDAYIYLTDCGELVDM